jgi:nucleoid DNA-binding protein
MPTSPDPTDPDAHASPDETADPATDSPKTASSEHADAPDLEAVAEALGDCVRDALERGETVEVPGMGTFRVEHRPSQMDEQPDGQFSVRPPRNVVVFDPVA